MSLKKTLVGLTPIRDSDIRSQAMTEMAPRLGGLVEFYRSPARTAWTPTGTNVPDYPKLAQLWWANVANAVSGESTAKLAMDSLAEQQDKVLARLERHGVQGECGPQLNEPQDPEYWLLCQLCPGLEARRLRNFSPKALPVECRGCQRSGVVSGFPGLVSVYLKARIKRHIPTATNDPGGRSRTPPQTRF